jgi:hypothetical protein
MLSDATMLYAEELTPALLGLDTRYATERGKSAGGTGGDVERLVVLNLSDRHIPDDFATYSVARHRFAELRALAAELPEPDRRIYYAQTCASAIAFATWREQGLAFPDQISHFLHVLPQPASDAELSSLCSSMRDLLVDLGYTGDLRTQIAAWEERQRVPADEVEGVLNDYLSDAWDLTADRMDIPAERSDGMRVETVTGVPYNAMCDFSRRLIRLNVEPTLTRPGLRHLAVHEGYPGHYVQFKRRQVGYAEGRAPADALLSVVNTASSTTFEGIADVGMDVIGWQTSLDDRLAGLLTRYRAGLGTRAAWRLHAGGTPPTVVRDELLREALVGGEGWVEARMRFISAHDRAALIWSYWRGEPSVRPIWQRVRDDAARRPAYFDWVYDRMHSTKSIELLDDTHG